jgi:hypothetical protein
VIGTGDAVGAQGHVVKDLGVGVQELVGQVVQLIDLGAIVCCRLQGDFCSRQRIVH